MITTAALLSLVTSPRPAWQFATRPAHATALGLPQPYVYALLTGAIDRVPWTGMAPRSEAVYLWAEPTEHDAFDAALPALVPALRAAGARVPYLADLPQGHLCGVARVAYVEDVHRRARHRTPGSRFLVLVQVRALPFAVELSDGRPGFFDVHGVDELVHDRVVFPAIEDGGPRDVAGAAAVLQSIGIEARSARHHAEAIVPGLVQHAARELACARPRRSAASQPTRRRRVELPVALVT